MKCPMCQTDNASLGSLGSRTHYSCRACGMEYSQNAKKHYHVLQGLEGCYMPNSNDTFTSKREALRYAHDQYKEAREEQRQAIADGAELRTDEHTWTGSRGYYSNGIECIEITTCSDPDCMECEE